MKAGTSPAFALGGTVGFQGSNGNLWTVGLAGGDTSPS